MKADDGRQLTRGTTHANTEVGWSAVNGAAFVSNGVAENTFDDPETALKIV